MPLRIQKKWSQLGNPQAPGDCHARGIGTIVGITIEQLQELEKPEDPVVVLEHIESTGMAQQWKILSIRAVRGTLA